MVSFLKNKKKLLTNGNLEKSNRMAWLDMMRILAALFIVAMHSSADRFGKPFPNSDVYERIFPVVFRSIVYIARTELFIIISLFLLLMSYDRKERPYGVVIVENAKRLLIPFVFWVVFYAFFRIIKAQYFGYEDAIFMQLGNLSTWFGFFVLGNVQYHMHFLPTMFLLVLIYPAYLLAVRRPELGILIVALLAIKWSADQFLWRYVKDFFWFEYGLRFVKILTYSGYGMMAASALGLLKKNFDRRINHQIILCAFIAISLLYLFKFMQAYLVIQSGRWAYSYQPGYWADFLMPAFLFLLIMGLKDVRFSPFFCKLAPFSFGIYLMHPAFLDLCEIMIYNKGLTPSSQVLVKFLFASFGSGLLAFIISKIPFLAWTIGLGKLKVFPKGLIGKMANNNKQNNGENHAQV